MEKQKGILIISPIIAARYSNLRWASAGFKVLAFLLPIKNIADFFKTDFLQTEFDEVIKGTGHLEKDIELIRSYQNNYDIVYGYVGWESTVEYGEKILRKLFPTFSNDPTTYAWRYNKYEMNERLREIGLAFIRQCHINEEKITPEIEDFIQNSAYPLVVKPSYNSAASDNVYFCNDAAEIVAHIHQIGNHGLLGKVTEILIQEKVNGIEYFVDSFSHAGIHDFSGVYIYKKYIINERPVYRTITIVDDADPLYTKMIDYVSKILTALGVEYGFSHTEVMLTEQNEIKLIELNLRPSGVAGYVNQIAFQHKQLDQYSLAIDFLNNTKTKAVLDGKIHCLFLLNNLGFLYDRVKLEMLKKLKSYTDCRLLKTSCNKLPEKTLLCESVAFIHLVHNSVEKLNEDIALLEKMELEGSLFEKEL